MARSRRPSDQIDTSTVYDLSEDGRRRGGNVAGLIWLDTTASLRVWSFGGGDSDSADARIPRSLMPRFLNECLTRRNPSRSPAIFSVECPTSKQGTPLATVSLCNQNVVRQMTAIDTTPILRHVGLGFQPNR